MIQYKKMEGKDSRFELEGASQSTGVLSLHSPFVLWAQQPQIFLNRAFQSIRDVLVDKR